VEALGIASLSRSEVSRICAALDAEVDAFRRRSLLGERYPYVYLDATYVKVRDAGRVVSMGCLVAIGVAASGERRVLGLDLAAGNDEGNAWAGFVRGLLERGLASVRLVVSDAHRGVVDAVHGQLLGAAWQRCRVHATRNALDLVPRGSQDMVAAAIRTIFEQPDDHSASEHLRRVADGLSGRFPSVSELLLEAEPDLLVHFTFPEAHRRQIRSTNPLERLNKEIKRSTAVVGIFPSRAAVLRLVGMVLAEQDDEWQDGRRYLSPESMALIDAAPKEEMPALLMAS
jgi:putative transposase